MSQTTKAAVRNRLEDDIDLPILQTWDKLAGDINLGKIDPEAETRLEGIENDFLTLGDLAYLDSITTTQITDSAITTPKLAAGAVTASRISVGNLAAINADLGTITAGTITGITITGSLVRTSSSGTRVQMNQSSNSLQIYSGSTLRAEGYEDGWRFNNSSGSRIADIYASGTALLITTLLGSSGVGSVTISGQTSGTVSLAIDGSNYIYASGPLGVVVANRHIIPSTTATYDLGENGDTFRHLFLNSVGYVNDTGSAGSPFPTGWSVSRSSAGVYTITHNIGGSSRYVVVAIPLSSSGVYMAKIGSRSSNSFTVRINDDAGTLVDCDFMFILIRNN